MNGRTEKIHTLAEAAEHLRLTTRAVAKIAKRHGLCMIAGRNILFTDSDIENIKEALRYPPQGASDRHVASSDVELAASLLALTRKKSASPKARAILLERSRKKYAQRLKRSEDDGDDRP